MVNITKPKLILICNLTLFSFLFVDGSKGFSSHDGRPFQSNRFDINEYEGKWSKIVICSYVYRLRILFFIIYVFTNEDTTQSTSQHASII